MKKSIDILIKYKEGLTEKEFCKIYEGIEKSLPKNIKAKMWACCDA